MRGEQKLFFQRVAESRNAVLAHPKQPVEVVWPSVQDAS